MSGGQVEREGDRLKWRIHRAVRRAAHIRRSIDRLRNWANMRPAENTSGQPTREATQGEIADLISRLVAWEQIGEELRRLAATPPQE